MKPHCLTYLKTRKSRHHFWKCKCGCIIPKKDAQLSGDPNYPKGYHVHCPRCGRVVAQYVNPK